MLLQLAFKVQVQKNSLKQVDIRCTVYAVKLLLSVAKGTRCMAQVHVSCIGLYLQNNKMVIEINFTFEHDKMHLRSIRSSRSRSNAIRHS